MLLSRMPARVAILVVGFLLLPAAAAMAAEGTVEGTIVINGKPLASGRVIFHQDNGQFVGSTIRNGKYAIDRIPTGTLKVSVEGVGVPKKFTSEDTTTLKAEVKGGRAQFDFNLRD